ncbi:hypothetical protein K435DRAFT_873660 [Dendrothele bispora CBS 962.96]|uniref:Uncharacterized protein n=1 Tax=Dendrothele bispora (strain CBS 962.96) TaxID=1314807 RepID=A0A4S8KYX8_DENBC|nr:hypothetical protein K435DRAFT_873660 [Dendrothele bispora CBS 962.96]
MTLERRDLENFPQRLQGQCLSKSESATNGEEAWSKLQALYIRVLIAVFYSICWWLPGLEALYMTKVS